MNDLDFGLFHPVDPTMHNALLRYGHDLATLGKLGGFEQAHATGNLWYKLSGREPACTTEYHMGGGTLYWYSWVDLFEIPNVSYRRILHLVNWLRDQGTELPWFADFDTASARWTALEGQHRAQPA